MGILKVLLFLVAAFGVFTVYAKYRQAHPAASSGTKASAKDPGLSARGFFLLKREEAGNPRVAIMSPPNCPSHEAQRARDLEAALQAAGVPCEIKSGIEFTFTDPADVDRVQNYMNSVANPLVLVRGWAKGNPSAEDIIAQYHAR